MQIRIEKFNLDRKWLIKNWSILISNKKIKYAFLITEFDKKFKKFD